jgi:cytochrome c553
MRTSHAASFVANDGRTGRMGRGASVLLLAAAALSVSTRGHAQAQAPATVAPPSAASCAACHGAQGEGNAGGGFPRLAGQAQPYLARQLASYADGSRNNAVMTPIAKGLSAQQAQEVAAYYASIRAPAAAPAKPAAKAQVSRGQQLTAVGDDSKMIQACANCHGPGGAGSPPTYPYLAGQHAGYIGAAMAEWKNGNRKNDPSKQMPMIAQRLSDADVAAVAAYYSSLPAPAPWQPQAVTRPVSRSTGATSSSGPGPAESGPKVPGVEQSQPTQGNTVGPGGAAASPAGK